METASIRLRQVAPAGSNWRVAQVEEKYVSAPVGSVALSGVGQMRPQLLGS